MEPAGSSKLSQGVVSAPPRQLSRCNACILTISGDALYVGRTCKKTSNGLHFYLGLLAAALWSSVHTDSGRYIPALRDGSVCVNVDACRPVQSPALGWCGQTPNSLVLPSYHEADCVQKHKYPFTLAHFELLIAARPLPTWSSRQPHAVWRGTCTGGLHTLSNYRTKPRTHIAILNASPSNSHLLDAGLIRNAGCHKQLVAKHPKLFMNASRAERIDDWAYSTFKYVIDLEGDGCSGRFAKLLRTGSVVLKYFAKGFPFFYSQLTPWVHYVPIRQDLSDLMSTVRWLQHNDKRAQDIGANGQAFAIHNLSTAAVQRHLLRVVNEAGIRSVSQPPPTLVFNASRGQVYSYSGVDAKRRNLSITCPGRFASSWQVALRGAAGVKS